MLVASEDGSTVYIFDSNGRHLRTVDAETGVVIHLFGYDANGRLTTVTNPDGNVTTIERATDGTPLAIAAPGGPVAAKSIDASSRDNFRVHFSPLAIRGNYRVTIATGSRATQG